MYLSTLFAMTAQTDKRADMFFYVYIPYFSVKLFCQIRSVTQCHALVFDVIMRDCVVVN